MNILNLIDNPQARQDAWTRLLHNDPQTYTLNRELTTRFPELTTEARLVIIALELSDRLEKMREDALAQARFGHRIELKG